ncbi:hypothetical protein D9M70_578040 [compost metagenome]
MKLTGELNRGRWIADPCLVLGIDMRFKLLDLRRRQPADQAIDHQCLQGSPHGKDIVPILEAGMADTGALVGTQFDQSLAVQPRQRLAHDRAANAEPLADRILRKLRSRSEGLD